MSDSRARRTKRSMGEPRPASALGPGTLAAYRRAARVSSLREQVRSLRPLCDAYQALVDAGDHVCAMGAALELVDLALGIAATPAPDEAYRKFKGTFFGHSFPSIAESIHHPHAARVALAAVAAEREPRGRGTGARH